MMDSHKYYDENILYFDYLKLWIEKVLGHSDFSTTANVYAHLDINSKLLSAEAII